MSTPADYVAEYFPENTADRLIEFYENLQDAGDRGAFADEFARRYAQSDSQKRTAFITVDPNELEDYLCELLKDDSEPDPDVEPQLAAVARAAQTVEDADNALRAAVVEAHNVGEPISHIANAANVTRPTIYAWIAGVEL